MNEIELAWAAGFFDGEGTTWFTGRNGVSLTITQYEVTVLERFICAVQVGKVYGPYLRRNGSEKYWNVYISTKGTIIALGKLWPYLSEPKKNQALQALYNLDYIEGRNSYTKVDREIIDEIRLLVSSGLSQNKIGKLVGVSQGTVNNVVNHKGRFRDNRV